MARFTGREPVGRAEAELGIPARTSRTWAWRSRYSGVWRLKPRPWGPHWVCSGVRL